MFLLNNENIPRGLLSLLQRPAVPWHPVWEPHRFGFLVCFASCTAYPRHVFTFLFIPKWGIKGFLSNELQAFGSRREGVESREISRSRKVLVEESLL